MNQGQKAVKQLIDEVLALSEATRFLATAEGDEFAAVEVVRACSAAIGRTIRTLENAAKRPMGVQAVPPGLPEPPAPLPSAEVALEQEPRVRLEGVDVIESLDDIFGRL